MRKIKYKRKHLGEMRTSQLITSYGVGAMVDFKDETAILAEADAWNQPPEKSRMIHCHNLEKVLGKEFFVRPKWERNLNPIYSDNRSEDIGAFRFSETLYCPHCERLIFNLEKHLDALLNEAEWCSSDPLCLMSSGKNAQGLFGLNYAACPQCALLPETSCSMRNSLLYRAALIGRSQDSTIGYFAGIL